MPKEQSSHKERILPEIDEALRKDLEADEEMDPDEFDLEQALITIGQQYPGKAVTDDIEEKTKAYIGAIKTANGDKRDRNVVRTKLALRSALGNLEDNNTKSTYVADNIFFTIARDLDMSEPTAKTKTTDKSELIGLMEEAIAGKIAGIIVSYQAVTPEDQERETVVTALSRLEESFQWHQPSEHTTNLLSFITDAACEEKLPQVKDGTHFEQLKQRLRNELLDEVLDGRASMANRIMNDAILSAAAEVTAPLIGTLGK